ncbi:MAG: protein-export chaperone SecB [Lentisphaeria bacterium]
MQPSNLQLKSYFLTHLDFSANPDFDLDAQAETSSHDIEVDYEKKLVDQEKGREWEVHLSLNCNPPANKNIPYTFTADIVGIFEVSEKVSQEFVYLYINTNATSVLYSTLREIICSTTAKGPFAPLILPTVSFYEPDNEPVESKSDINPRRG